MPLEIGRQVGCALAIEVALLFLLLLQYLENHDRNEAMGDILYAKTFKFAYPTSRSKSRFRWFLNN